MSHSSVAISPLSDERPEMVNDSPTPLTILPLTNISDEGGVLSITFTMTDSVSVLPSVDEAVTSTVLWPSEFQQSETEEPVVEVLQVASGVDQENPDGSN